MHKVVFVYERKIATVEILHKIFTNQEAVANNIDCVFLKYDEITNDSIRGAFVIVFLRCEDLFSQLLLIKLKTAGYFCVQFYDDDINSIPDDEKRYVQRLAWRKKAINDGFYNTDCILVSNPLLGAEYSKLIPSKRYVVMETPVGNELDDVSYNEETSTVVNILYAASAKHNLMFEKYICPIIPKLIDKYKSNISFTFIGVKPNLREYASKLNCVYIASMPLDTYRRYIRGGNYQIGIAPLEENSFTRYKYYNKFVEYTIAGAVGVYSNIPVYNIVIKHGENGYLCDNTPESWFKNLCLAIDNKENRIKCFENAYSFFRNERDYHSVYAKLVEDLPELCFETPASTKPPLLVTVKIKYLSYRLVEIVILLCHFIKDGGPKGLIEKIFAYFREKASLGKEKVE